MSTPNLLVVFQLVAFGLIAAPLAADTTPDISVESLAVAKSTVSVFEPLNVSAVVRNGGNDELKGVVVRLSSINPPNTIAEYSVNLLPKKDIGLSWTTFLPAGTHEIAVAADPDDAIAESNEQNNVRTHQVTVEQIPLSEEASQRIREIWEKKAPGDTLGPYVILKPIRADLYPDLWIVWLTASDEAHVGVSLRNGGPDAIPQEVLDLVTVTVEFIGAPTDHTCTASLKGHSKGKLSSSGDIFLDIYTESTGPCPRALLEAKLCDPVPLSFWCVELPDLRLSVNLPTSNELFYTGYLLVDPKPYNNIRIEKKGKR